MEFQSNDTVKITFEAINNQRIKVTLQYKDRITQKPVSKERRGMVGYAQSRPDPAGRVKARLAAAHRPRPEKPCLDLQLRRSCCRMDTFARTGDQYPVGRLPSQPNPGVHHAPEHNCLQRRKRQPAGAAPTCSRYSWLVQWCLCCNAISACMPRQLCWVAQGGKRALPQLLLGSAMPQAQPVCRRPLPTLS